MKEHKQNTPPAAPKMPPALQDWVEEHPPEKRRKLERSWTLAGLAEAPPAGSEATGATWEGVADALRDDPGRKPAPAGRRAPDRAPAASRSGAARARRWAAAFVAVVLLAAAGLWLWMRPVTVTAPAGTTETVELPDGSRATLNSGSSLTYQRGPLQWSRDVRLQGEAFFEVEEGEETFTVATFNVRAEVLGTRFNVRARPEVGAPVTAVTLITGALRLFGEEGKRKPVTLAPGQKSRVTGSGGVPSSPVPADLSTVLAWRRGGLAFPESPIGTILDELERRFAVEIRASQALRRDSLSLYLSDAPGATAVLTDLCAVQGCDYRRASEGVFVVE